MVQTEYIWSYGGSSEIDSYALPYVYISSGGLISFVSPGEGNGGEWEGGTKIDGVRRTSTVRVNFTLNITDGTGQTSRTPFLVTFVRRGASVPPLVLVGAADGRVALTHRGRRKRARRGVVWLVAFMLVPSMAMAGDRYALVIGGAAWPSSTPEKSDTWRKELVRTLRDIWEYPVEHVVELAEKADGMTRVAADRENVRAALTSLRSSLTPDSTLLIVLIGHGAGGDDTAKFNLVGPDMTARVGRGTCTAARTAGVRQHRQRQFSVSRGAGRPQPRRSSPPTTTPRSSSKR